MIESLSTPNGQDAAPSRDWHAWIDAAGPASLLVVIEDRMSVSLRRLHTAEDVLQEALLHAWRSRGQVEWRGVKSFRNWLLSIIDNRIRDLADRESAQKRGGSQKPVSFSELRPAAASTTDSAQPFDPVGSTTPSRLAMFREQAQTIRACLNTLPDELREVVRLRLLDQFSIEDVAAQLGIGVSAARHRLRKGAELYHARLRAELASKSASHGDSGASQLRDAVHGPRPRHTALPNSSPENE